MEEIDAVYIASVSGIKTRAVGSGLRALGIDANVEGVKVKSDVSDQPIGFAETYRGAINRLQNLRRVLGQLSGGYLLIALENGLFVYGDRKDYFDTALCLIENSEGEKAIATSTGVQIPDDVANHIIDNGLEVGPYMMERYGIQEKDPAAVFTAGKVNRSEILALAVKMAVGRLINNK